MAPKKKMPIDNQQSAERPAKQTRRNTQNRGELNRNEERIADVNSSDKIRKTPAGERPDVAADQWTDQQNQTTGSNVPGSEIADRQNKPGEQWQGEDELNRVDDIHHPGQHHTGLERNRPNQMYTGNSERSGQQYSAERSKSPAYQNKRDHLDQSDGSQLSRTQKQKQGSLHAADSRQQKQPDQSTARQPHRQKKTDETDGGE